MAKENDFPNDRPFDRYPYRRGFKSHWSINREGFISHPYFARRWGLVQGLPTSFDNAESIYELIAWLQKMMKRLLDDFEALEAEFDEFKNAMIELLEELIPELIRQFAKSEEFKNIIKDMLKSDEFQDLLEEILRSERFKELFKDILKEVMKDPEMREWFKEFYKEIMNDNDMKEYFKDYLKDTIKELANDPEWQKIIQDLLEDLLKDNKWLKNQLNGLYDLISSLSGQPPYAHAVEGFIPNYMVRNGSPEYQHATIDVAVQKIGNRSYIWYRPNLSFIQPNKNLVNGDLLFSVSKENLRKVGMPNELINGISKNNAAFSGATTGNGDNVLLRLREQTDYPGFLECVVENKWSANNNLFTQPNDSLYIINN